MNNKYICHDCGAVFDPEDANLQPNVLDDYTYSTEYWEVCPNCGSDFLEEVPVQCNSCKYFIRADWPENVTGFDECGNTQPPVPKDAVFDGDDCPDWVPIDLTN